MKAIIVTITILFLIAAMQVPGLAQNALTDADRSVIAFEINIEQLVANAKAKGIDITPFLQARIGGGPLGSLEWKDVKQIRGAMNLPENRAEIEEMANKREIELPVDGYVRLTVLNAESAGAVVEGLAPMSNVTTAPDGSTEYRPKSDDEPKNMVIKKLSDTEFELLVGKFQSANKRDFKTAKLQTQWDALPAKAVRIAGELKTNAQFVKETVQFAADFGGGLAPPFDAYLELFTKLDSFGLTADFADDDLIGLAVTANSVEDAQEVQSALNSLLFIAKSYGKGFLAQIEDKSSPIVTAGNGVLASLKANQNDTRVDVTIKAPKEAAAAMAAATIQVRQRAQEIKRQNNLRQAVLAVLNFESAHMSFPFNMSKKGKINPDLSWRVLVSQFVEGPGGFDMAQGPKAEKNAQFAQQMPKCFGEGNTHSNLSWVVSDVTGFNSIPDGSSNTVCFIENPNGKSPWLERNDISQADAIKMVKGLQPGEEVMVAFYDGSVHKFTSAISEATLRLLFDPLDGEVIDHSEY